MSFTDGPIDRMMDGTSLRRSMDTLSGAFRTPGGVEISKAGLIFAEIRMRGAKMPYRRKECPSNNCFTL